MLSSIKASFTPVIDIVAKPFAKIHPNYISIVGLISPILFMWAIGEAHYFYAFLAMLLAPLDMLDGAVARISGKVSGFGGLLDSTIDRVSDAIYISSFGFAGLLPWWLVVSVLITSYLISYIRCRAELASKGTIVLNIGILERTERLIMIAFIALLYLFNYHALAYYAMILLLLLSIITIFQRLQKSYEVLR
ncbi:MAG: CDP-alcohol phosphatidyltransferase family protein [Candidatus Roizmanbacteria bacterium]